MYFEFLELREEAILVFNGKTVRKFNLSGLELQEDVPSHEVYKKLCDFQKPDEVQAGNLEMAMATFLKARILA